jgi:hypothetical protein
MTGKGEFQATCVSGTVDGSDNGRCADEEGLALSGEVSGAVRVVKFPCIHTRTERRVCSREHDRTNIWCMIELTDCGAQ